MDRVNRVKVFSGHPIRAKQNPPSPHSDASTDARRDRERERETKKTNRFETTPTGDRTIEEEEEQVNTNRSIEEEERLEGTARRRSTESMGLRSSPNILSPKIFRSFLSEDDST
ncbi:uncharacterized protein LOC131328464 [Rhododendron vialii]|uniref:uncharacterized protein LOC131328464 n=1 Tax=Rhododendron vialii TaxID=182163 RepID=UPI00266003CF|nr:uncharacterized protein LOC131328464 [Rhododendron vialii]